ncbi:MAG: type 2 lanthipeptide synthetase LanM [Sphingomonas sp.]|jgi:type 2 lantibiotic biosynthesis protein LanM|uniref:type 2 lanthipeptide synthetase LanM n=1 Tax=Sphingomonas sp. TaxID=28214 RepID=UPI00356660BF
MHDLTALEGFFVCKVDLAIESLLTRIRGHATASGPLLASLTTSLKGDLFELTHRTLIAQYKLVEDSVRFEDYASALSGADLQHHFKTEFPVLSRQVDQLVTRWLDNTARLLIRFAADRHAIAAEVLLDVAIGEIAGIRFALGDPHRGGQSVAIIQLNDSRRIVYKPRSLAVDGHFADLVAWIGSGVGLDLRVPRLLERKEYGWVEFIDHRVCLRQEEIDIFYKRLGVFLALLYMLEASDFHYENIIAHGAHPMLIDLEAFFHPRTPIVGTETNEGIDNSVLQTGMLPDRISFGAGRSVEVGGMSVVRGQEGLVDRLVLSQSSDGHFTFRRDRGIMVGANNVPKLVDREVGITERSREWFKSGFAEAYRFVVSDRSNIIAMISRFRDDEIRVLFRDTIVYTHLLDEARHPALLLRDENLTRHFAGLSTLSRDFPLGEVLLPFETECLQRRDVPMFTCRVGGVDLIIDEGRTVAGFFVRSGLDIVRDKISRMDEGDLARQLWIIDKALDLQTSHDEPMTSALMVKSADQPVASLKGPAQTAKLRDRFLAQASKIASFVTGEMHQDDLHASWMVVRSVAEDNSMATLHNAFYDLYAGMPGEIAYLTQMAALTDSQAFLHTAEKAHRFLLRRLTESSYSIRPIGLFTGWGSIILLQTALGIWHRDTSFLDAVETLIDRVNFTGLIDVDRNFSLLKGAAGFGFACAEYHRVSGSRRAIDLATQAFDHLLKHRDGGGIGSSWRIASALPLSGLSHGASGFATAFAKMYEVTGDRRYRTACLDALAFENSVFVPEERNWLDQRDVVLRTGQARCSTSWAHGAPGIGIARASIMRSGIITDQIVEDLHQAVATTLKAGLGTELAVVSGALGRIELALVFAENIGDEYLVETQSLLERLSERIEAYTDQLEQKRNVPLGLLSGITGLGYQCLRIADASVPSLVGMMLEPAKGRILSEMVL